MNSARRAAPLLALVLLAGCTATPASEPTTDPPQAPSPSPTASSPEPELDVSAITAALEGGDASAVGPYFAETVRYGSAGSGARPDKSGQEAEAALATQMSTFGALNCSPDAALVDSYRANLDATMSDWLPDDAIVCTSDTYLTSFVPTGQVLTGYYTIPIGIYG